MNDYQIVQDVGRSKYSLVYKGRKKKTVMFYALKCVDKSQKRKIMHEVKFLHRLHSPYVVQFHEWFETANHLWLVLEYCPGNRLYDLLQADLKLPESSVKMFGLNLLGALQFLHSNGIVYGNLKPSAVQIDASGLLKLSDFSLSAYVGSQQSDADVQNRTKRGTPTYMAPELFHPEGPLSFQSDLWSLGVCMYEMSSGRAPFVSPSFKTLITLVVTEPYVPLPALSPDFNELCGALLEKDPWTRPTWDEIRESVFWEYSLPYAVMPAQPGLEAYTEARREEAEEEGRSDGAGDEGGAGVGGDEGLLRRSGVDVVALCQAVHQSQARGSVHNYRASIAHEASGGEDPDVGPDEEVDLGGHGGDAREGWEEEEEEEEEGGGLEVEGGDAGGGEEYIEGGEEWGGEEEGFEQDMGVHGGGIAPFGATHGGAENAAFTVRDEIEEEREQVQGGVGVGGAGELVDEEEEEEERGRGGGGGLEDGEEDEGGGVRPFSAPIKKGLNPSVGKGRPFTAFAAAGAAPSDQVAAVEGEAGRGGNVSELLWCMQDMQVRPIILNKRIEKVAASHLDAKNLPFDAKVTDAASHYEGAHPDEVGDLVSTIQKSLGDKTSVGDKLNIMAYLERLCASAVLSDFIVGSELCLMLVRMMRKTKSTPLRGRVAHVLGLLIRHATFLPVELQRGGLVVALSEGMRDRDARVRRNSMAAFGELLFYMTSQEGEGGDDVEGEGGVDETWQLPSGAAQAMMRGLRSGEDTVVQHYVSQSLDNLASGGGRGEHLAKLATYEMVTCLLGVVHEAQDETLRGTASSAMSRLSRISPSLAAQVVDKAGLDAVVERLGDDNARVQAAFLNLINTALLHPSQRLLKALELEVEKVLQQVMRLIDHSQASVRAKCLVTLQLLFRTTATVSLLVACERKLMPTIERLTRENDPYLSSCLSSLLSYISDIVPAIAHSISDGLASIAAQRKPIQPGADLKPLKAPLSLLTVLLHVVASPTTRPSFTGSVLTTVSGFLHGWDSVPFQGSAEFRRVLMLLVEAVSQHPQLILPNHEVVISGLVPALVRVAVGQDGGSGTAQRFQCLRALGDVLATILTDRSVYDPSAQAGSGSSKSEHAAACTKLLHEQLVRHLLPRYPQLLAEKEPVPTHAILILRHVMQHNSAFGIIISRLGLVPRLLGFMEPEGSHCSSHLALLVKLLIECGDLDMTELQGFGLGPKVGALIEFMVANQAEDFYEPVLDTMSAIMYNTAMQVQEVEESGGDASELLSRNEGLLQCAPSLAKMCIGCSGDMGDAQAPGGAHWFDMRVCEAASQCVLLLAHTYPLHVLSSVEAARDVASGIRNGSETVRKRLLKAVLWVLNGGDIESIEAGMMELEDCVHAVCEQEGEDSSIGKLASEVLGGIQNCLGFEADEDEGDEAPHEDSTEEAAAVGQSGRGGVQGGGQGDY